MMFFLTFFQYFFFQIELSLKRFHQNCQAGLAAANINGLKIESRTQVVDE